VILLFLAFIAGALTALAPCVLPLLPIIIGGAISGDEKDRSRPYLIAGSLAASLILFTYLLKVSSIFIGVSPQLWINFSAGLVIALGISTLFPSAWDRISAALGWQVRSDRLLQAGVTRKGRIGAIATGVALGPVFSSCSPTYAFILATILPKNLVAGLFYLLAYSLGLVTILLLISIKGRKFLNKFSWAIDSHGVVRRSLGMLFILIGIGIGFGYDKKAELWITTHTPFDVSSIDQSLLAQVKTPGQNPSGSSATNVSPYLAPELTGLQSWLNSSPLTLKSLRGKVVMIDFWTYSCINCVRTLPYIEKWYQTYKSKGFVVIGIHAPEFGFEKVLTNVEKATKQYGLTYPIALDNNLMTWNAFANQYWPAHYLINRDGKVVNVHYGEGEYLATEKAIQSLLGDSTSLVSPKEVDAYNPNQTPETYFGTERASRFMGNGSLQDGVNNFQPRLPLLTDFWTIGGSWNVESDKITSQRAGATLTFKVNAKDVYLVASVADSRTYEASVKVIGEAGNFTSEDPLGKLIISGSNLYHLATFPIFGEHTISLTVPPGVSLHTFTFGG